MKILTIENFEKVDDPIKTEETIFQQLIKHEKTILSDYTYIAMPIAWNINNYGLQKIQEKIDKICSLNKKEKIFFVCQHILVNKLNFHNNLVFTPHATKQDNYMPIPHYSCNFDISYIKPWKERKYDFSFMGDFNSHPTRSFLKQAFNKKQKTAIIDTNTWHFYTNEKTQKINKSNYIELLGDTKFSLCPRGTGPSTIRIWESMAMNSHPIILSDSLKMPLELFLETNLWTFKPEDETEYNLNFEQEYSNKEYWEYFSNNNLSKSIMEYL